jgi:ABC-type phosphate/phosphonate transport system permease subunit
MQLQNQGTALKAAASSGSWRNAMVPPSFSTLELELLISLVGVLIFVGSFLALLFSLIFGLGLARLLYLSGRWCVKRIHQLYPLGGERPTNAIVRIVPHHSH